MSYNYNHVLDSLGSSQGSSRRSSASFSSPRVTSPVRHARASSPVLVQPLPPSRALERESVAQSELELDRQQRQAARERAIAEALEENHREVAREAARDDVGSWTALVGKGKGKEREQAGGRTRVTEGFTHPPQAYELYQAIDKHDIDYIMRVRDHAFPLLLQKNAGEFPIVYAARIGNTHRDVLILLVGALSRWVNHLEEADFEKKETRNILKALRTNLKLAIDYAISPASSSSLLSSYLQVLIMSEGDAWIHKASHDLGLVLRDPQSRPVAEAESMVRRFCTKELRGVPGGIGDVEEYIANATLDLVIMAAWSVAAGQMDVDILPTHTFARDLRTWQTLNEAMTENRDALSKVTKRVRFVLQQLCDIAGDTKKGVRGRVRDVGEALDHPL